jgi:hypothetical protein
MEGGFLGVYRDGRWLLSDTIEGPSLDHDVGWGYATDIPVTGDWNGDGKDSIGVYRGGRWLLSDTIEGPSLDYNVGWGLGVYRDGRWLLSDTIEGPSLDHDVGWGYATDIPVTGDWS